MSYVQLKDRSRNIPIMPYRSIIDLLDDIHENFPNQARKIYQESYDKARDEYKKLKNRRDVKNREDSAHKVAWHAVKDEYEKGDNGIWYEK